VASSPRRPLVRAAPERRRRAPDLSRRRHQRESRLGTYNARVDYDQTRAVLEAFEREGVEYVIFGAVALNLQGLARATEDLDVFVAPTEENIRRLRTALRSVFEDPHIDEITADDLLGDYPAVQYVPPEGTFHVDILTRLGDAFRFEDLESERVDFDGLTVSVVTPATLYRMKKSTVRARDRADAERLRERFGFGEP